MLNLLREHTIARYVSIGAFVVLMSYVASLGGLKVTGLMSMAITFALCVLLDFAASDQSGRKVLEQRMRHTLVFVFGNAGTMALAVVGLLSYFAVQQPAEPFVAQVQSATQGLAIPFLVVLASVGVVRLAMALDVFSGSRIVSSSVQTMIRAASWLAICIWVIGVVGDEIYVFALEEPAALALLLIVGAVFAATARLSSQGLGRQEEGAQASLASMRALVMTQHDRRHAAAHEAGHALLYSVLDQVPSGLTLEVSTIPSADGTMGYVGIDGDCNQLVSTEFAQWRMWVCLAGEVGERVLLGHSTLGSTSDHNKWLALAHSYLSCQQRGTFFINPSSKLELEWNSAALDTLRKEQICILETFFERNADVHAELAGAALRAGKMGEEELKPFLSRVVLPEGIRRVSFTQAAAVIQ